MNRGPADVSVGMGDWAEKRLGVVAMPVGLPGKIVFGGDVLDSSNEVLPGWQATKNTRKARTKYR